MRTMISAYKWYQFHTSDKFNTPRKFVEVLQKVLEERNPELDISIEKITILPNKRIEIIIQGKNPQDEIFICNIWKELLGEFQDYSSLQKGQIIRGFCQDVGKVGFGLFVDAGVNNPEKQILVPLYELRKQLTANEKIATREILNKYGLMDYSPIEIQITDLEGDDDTVPQIEACLSPAYLELIQNRIKNSKEIVFTTGTPRQNIKKAIAISGHTQDILEVERLGPLETAIICKSGTFSPGIVSKIGPHLSSTRFSMFRPAQVRRYWDQSK